MSASRSNDFESLAFGSGQLSLAPDAFAPTGFDGSAMDPRDALLKRISDVLLALVFLAFAGIPMLLIAAAIRLTSSGPALFRQERIGLNGRHFVMLKFRTMLDAPKRRGILPAGDPP